jgi:molybdate transport system substrate-binding protein
LKNRFIKSLLALLFQAACAYTPPGDLLVRDNRAIDSGSTQAEITVAAAADLQFAFSDLARLFEERTGHKVTLVFGSSGQLSQQIENGAPYDLIASANVDYISQLADKKLVFKDSITLYARGQIVLAANRQAVIQTEELEDLLDPKIRYISIADPEHAPYGVAAKQALEAAGLWDLLEPKLVTAENVRQALQYVQTGDAQAGIIALSVAEAPEITWRLIDESLHQPLEQALAIVASSRQYELADQFIQFINNQESRDVMRRYGFILPDETPITGTRSAPWASLARP